MATVIHYPKAQARSFLETFDATNTIFDKRPSEVTAADVRSVLLPAGEHDTANVRVAELLEAFQPEATTLPMAPVRLFTASEWREAVQQRATMLTDAMAAAIQALEEE